MSKEKLFCVLFVKRNKLLVLTKNIKKKLKKIVKEQNNQKKNFKKI